METTPVNPPIAFLDDDSGAVTVDWVVLTAAIMGLGLLVVGPVAFGTDSLATKVSSSFSGNSISITLPTHSN